MKVGVSSQMQTATIMRLDVWGIVKFYLNMLYACYSEKQVKDLKTLVSTTLKRLTPL